MDPSIVLERKQEATCLGCGDLIRSRWGGVTKYLCNKAIQKASTEWIEMRRCKKYHLGAPMTRDESEQIEILLTDWYQWQAGYFPALGGGRVDPSCRNFAESDRHSDIEDRTDAAERRLKKKQAEQVDLCVDALIWQQRASIQTHMKNKLAGVEVWSNPRITFEEMHELYQDAKQALLPALRRRGMIKSVVVG
ncbi:hypothetical protein [Caballeronia sp. DA-9]|uniref:hypothetical protein n=1 Tax=Caballeronia sp. DA-9 TaxID=3436237 RepID=UPI003F6719E7